MSIQIEKKTQNSTENFNFYKFIFSYHLSRIQTKNFVIGNQMRASCFCEIVQTARVRPLECLPRRELCLAFSVAIEQSLSFFLQRSLPRHLRSFFEDAFSPRRGRTCFSAPYQPYHVHNFRCESLTCGTIELGREGKGVL